MWYVLQVYNGSELAVKNKLEIIIKNRGLENKIKEVLVPYENVISISPKMKRTELKKALYPGYVYLNIPNFDLSIYEIIKLVPKASKFIGDKNHPTPMKKEEIEKIKNVKKTLSKTKIKKFKVNFEKGSKVIINEGAFANFKGIVIKHNPENKKVTINISVFGRDTPVEVNEQEIEIIY